MVVDDGTDFTTTEPMIQDMWSWVSFLYCQSNGVSVIVKDIFKEDGGIPACVVLDTSITECQHWFSTHVMKDLIVQLGEGDEPKTFL